MSKDIAEKFTFAEMKAHREAILVNSNLENVTTALKNVEQTRQELKKKLADLDKLETEINEMAAAIEGGTLEDVASIRTLYEKARGRNSRAL